MTIRSKTPLAAVLALLAAPAAAQYDPGEPPPLPQDEWHEEWQDDRDFDRYARHGARHADRRAGWEAHGLPPLPDHAGTHPRYSGYAPEQRAAWLEQCRRVYYDDRGERRGEVIGGVLGGVAGAVAGNRIADDSRLAGTLIGGGVGALAGSAVGGAVGESADRRRYEDRLDECEAYLADYERAYAGGYGHPSPHGAYGYGYAGPVMWVKVPIVRHRHGRDCGCERVVERVVEEPVARRIVPAPDKRVPIEQPAPDKRVRYVK